MLNLVFGVPAEISAHLIPQPVIRLVTFTGSIAVGKQLTALAGKHMKPVIMELGGHSPVFVCDDTNVELAASSILTAKSRNAGQVCVAPTRIFVENRVYESFKNAFVARARAVRLGCGTAPETHMGPMANERRVAAVKELVADAVAHGANILAGGEAPSGKGFFYPLTVLDGVPSSAEAMRNEPFGPLAMLICVPDLSVAIAQANSVPLRTVRLRLYRLRAKGRSPR